MTEKEFGSLFLNFSAGALGSIVVKRITETYRVQKSRQTMQNILRQPHRRSGDRAGIGAKPLNEISSQEHKPEIVCGECGQEWKQSSKKCWVCGNQRPMTRVEYDKLKADSQLVKIDGKLWRLTLGGGGVTWESMEELEPGVHAKQGQVDGCSLAEAPPCPVLENEEEMGELTMAEQISLNHRVHIRQEIVENKPEKEEQHSTIRAMAKATDDIDPGQSFHLWRPEYEKAERLQTEITSAGGTKQKKDHQAAKARREVEAVKLATQSIQAQQSFLADFQEGMLEVNPEEITNPMAKNFRSANLEETKRHLLTKLLEGKPTSMVDALLANQRTEQNVWAALQAEGTATMITSRVIAEETEAWPKDIQLMVEQGYFTPMEDTPLKNHDWREDIMDKYNQLKTTLSYGRPTGMSKLLTEMPLPEEASRTTGDRRRCQRPCSREPGGEPLGGEQAGHPALRPQRQLRTGKNDGRTLDQGQGDVIWPTWAEGSKLNRSLLVALEARTHPLGSHKEVDSVTGVYYAGTWRAPQVRGHDPMIQAFWAKWTEHFTWRRECMTWDLPTLLGIHGTKHTLRTLYNYWCDLPIALSKTYRGNKAPESATALRQKNWHQAQKRMADFLKSTGTPHPETAEE